MTDPRKSLHLSFRIAAKPLTLLALVATLATPSHSQTYQVIHRFSSVDGANPDAGLVMDAAGRLYGTTAGGGAYEYGTVFKLTPSGSSWVLNPLYNFAGGEDGDNPVGVSFGPEGSLYGVIGYGSDGTDGAVFSLQPPLTACKTALCLWRKAIVHAFEGNDGTSPNENPIFDDAGNLYGTTYSGGLYGAGVVYELTPTSGTWTETVLYNFAVGSLGYPAAGVTFDNAGNLYGTTKGFTQGGVYQLTPSGAGWAENQLYVFQGGNDGGFPLAGVIFDGAGNLYGATTAFGAQGGGTAFELMPSDGGWTFSVLYGFFGSCCGEDGPWANLIMDAAGNLYGTTYGDGAYGLGAVFQLTPGPGGWTYTSLHDFTGPEGAYPRSNVAFDASGNLYGTTSGGGRQDVCSGGCGVVWEITP